MTNNERISPYRYSGVRFVEYRNQHVEGHQNSYDIERTKQPHACHLDSTVTVIVNMKVVTIYVPKQRPEYRVQVAPQAKNSLEIENSRICREKVGIIRISF